MSRSKIFRSVGSSFHQEFEKFEKENEILDIRELKNTSSAYPYIYVKYQERKDCNCEQLELTVGESDIKNWPVDIPNIGDKLENGKVIEICAKIKLLKNDGKPGKVCKYIKLR